jgi:amino acid transporter
VSYAELGTSIPSNGGAYVYLDRIYGPSVSRLYSWTVIAILKPVSVAIAGLICGEYVGRLAFAYSGGIDNAVWVQRGTSLFCVWLVVGLNVMGFGWVAKINSFLTVIKIASLASVGIIGLYFLSFLEQNV